MSYLLAFLGFIALIVLHEAGHFTAAKAVGMRVERFCLFFPPLIAKVKRGETEYGIGAIPLGGYVKITGMSPNEDIPRELLSRAYYNQPVWKRIVVIAAGPAVNIALAIVIVWILLMSSGEVSQTVTKSVAAVDRHGAAAHVLRPGDEIVSVDGVTGPEQKIHRLIERHRCAGTPTNGCRARTPAKLVVRRDGHLVHVSLRPRYEKVSLGAGKTESEMLIGIEFAAHINHPGFLQAGSDSVTKLWAVSKDTVSTVVRIFEPKERRQLHGVVGTYDTTANYF